MKNKITFVCLLFFFVIWSQKKEITISASSENEAEVVVKIRNNTSKNKYLFLDVNNLGVFYNGKIEMQNINSAKMYIDFLEFNRKTSFIAVSTFTNFNCRGEMIEDFETEIKGNNILFLPNQEKKFVINIYKQQEMDYIRTYKILHSKTYNVSVKIIGKEIQKRIEKSGMKKETIRKLFSKYDFNNYQSNTFKLKIKAVKNPPPPPPPPLKIKKYSFEELMKMK